MSKVLLNDITKLRGMSKWKVLKFKDCVKQINTGLNPRKNFTLGYGQNKYITAKNLTQYGMIDFDNCDYIDDEAKQIIHQRSDIQIGDILFSSRAPIGQCHLIKEAPSDYDIGESIFSIRVNDKIVLPSYFCLYLTSDIFVQSATKNVTGSVIQEIRIGDLMNIDVLVPPRNIQERIAHIIDSIDEKIMLNNSICQNFDSIAKTIYDYWFLQFDFPNEEGKPYRSSGGEMVWNEELKREIPEGWECKNLKGMYSVDRGISYSSKDLSEDSNNVPMLNLACIDINRNYRDGELKYINHEVNKEKLLNSGDMLIATTDLTRNADIVGCPILVPYDDNQYTYSMDLAKIKSTSSSINDWYLYSSLRTDHYHNFIKKWASGTNVLHLDLSGLDWYKLVIPDLEVQKKYAEIIKKISITKSNILGENQKLTSLRDFLLPMLMNGQVTFKEEA
ncbi:restriction endonuclease subunit S [Catenibacterium mitsuokai]|uniref:restriction endonuclease subunit S n=1 Tax=Catenibacterium mitsuokai TaxID=100886 RepID=UPI003F8873C2